MAEYLILIYGDEAALDGLDPAGYARLLDGHRTFAERHALALRGGNALERSATATSLRPDQQEGGPGVTDGPFAETKEALGGYYLIEAKDVDEALAIAGEVPAPFGGVEVRPVRIFS